MKKINSILAVVASCAAVSATAQEDLTIILDWFVNPNHGPILIAQEQGYFEAQGLNVEIIAPADPADPPKLVAAGKADLAISYQPQLHLQIHEELPLQRVGTLIASPLNCLIVLDEGPITSIGDLKGRKVGFSVAGVEEALLNALFAPYGFGIDDIELVNVNWSLSPSLMSGQVDAVIGAYRNYEITIMDLEGVPGRCFYLEEEGLPPFDELIYVANSDAMDKQKIAKFLAATELAVQFMVNRPEESWEIFAAIEPELNDNVNRRAWFDTLARFALRPAALDAQRYRRFEKFLFDAELIPDQSPVAAIAIDVTAD